MIVPDMSVTVIRSCERSRTRRWKVSSCEKSSLASAITNDSALLNPTPEGLDRRSVARNHRSRWLRSRSPPPPPGRGRRGLSRRSAGGDGRRDRAELVLVEPELVEVARVTEPGRQLVSRRVCVAVPEPEGGIDRDVVVEANGMARLVL